jgi:hypothetical protein
MNSTNNNHNNNQENQNNQNGTDNNINVNNDNNNNNESKVIEVNKKSAMPILSFGVSFALLAMVTRLNNPTKLVLIAALSFVVYQIVKSKFPPKKIELCMEEEDEPEAVKEEPVNPDTKNPELKLINERIDLYFIEIKLLSDSIDDEFISAELTEMEETLKKIQVQVNDETKANLSRRIDQVNDFFDYYMPTTIKILNSYRKIESQHLTGDNATETKKRVEETLPIIKRAFNKELDNLFSDEMIDITTDIDVLESLLSKDGLIDKNNINSMNNTNND